MLTFRTAAEPDFEHVNRLARQVHELHVSLHPDMPPLPCGILTARRSCRAA